MQTALWLLLPAMLLSAARAADTTALAPFPQFYTIGQAGLNEAFAEEAKADFSIDYYHDGTFSIGIGAIRDGAQNAIRFSFEELRPFWKQQRHKDFIVVTLAKSTQTNEERQALVQRLNAYFFEMGFCRVRIHQGLGTGVGVLSDMTATKKAARRPSRAALKSCRSSKRPCVSRPPAASKHAL